MSKIYKITNNQNGKIYVGQTSKTLQERLDKHFYCSAHENRQQKFYSDILNYGRNAFSIELIEECPDEMANIVESYWIYKLNSIETGYNSCLSIGKNNTSPKGMSNEEYLEKLKKECVNLKKKNQNTQSVDQFTLEGEYIQTFPSARAAEIFLFGDDHKAGRVSFIQQACRGAKPKAYGYKWAYHNDEDENETELVY